MTISEKERNNNAIDLLIALTVEEIAKEDNRSTSEELAEFLTSKTAKEVYDDEAKLWWDGPSAIADMYRNEKRTATGV